MVRYSSDPLRISVNSPAVYLGFGATLCALAVLYVVLRHDIEPLWVLLAFLVLLVVGVLVCRLPVLLLVGFQFVGVLKTHAASGVSLTDPTLLVSMCLVAALAFDLWLVFCGRVPWRSRDHFAGQAPALLTFFLFLLVVALSYLYTPNPEYGAIKLANLATFDTLAFLAPLVLLKSDREVRQLVAMNVFLSVFLAARVMVRLSFPSDQALSGMDATQIGDGSLIGIAVLLLLYHDRFTQPFYRAIAMGGILLLTLGVTMSVSRTALFSMLIATAVSLVIIRRPPAVCSKMGMALGLAAMVAGIPLALRSLEQLPAAHDKLVQKETEVVQLFRGDPSGTAGERVSFTESAVSAFLAKPVLGWGVGGWSTLYHMSDERVVRYPHNFVLEIAAEQGAIGLITLVTFIAVLGKAMGKLLRARRYLFIMPVVLLCLSSGVISGQLDDRFLWFWCGVTFALARIVAKGPLQRLA